MPLLELISSSREHKISLQNPEFPLPLLSLTQFPTATYSDKDVQRFAYRDC